MLFIDIYIRNESYEYHYLELYYLIYTIIFFFRQDTDLSRVDSNEFHKNFIFCLNNLYQLENCHHDNLSNHLVANGYLKYFLLLTLELP